MEAGCTVAGMPLLIRPYGGDKGQWQWLLVAPGVQFDIGHGRLNGICCRARLGSAFLWEHGYRAAWDHVKAFLETLGKFAYQPSEVHLCVDIAGRPFKTLQQRAFITRGHVVRMASEDALILELEPSESYQRKRTMAEIAIRYREPETLSFSMTAPQSAVIYNKPREIRLHSRDKVWFADIWKANGWDGESPVVRVEFRSEREVLNAFKRDGDVSGIDTMPDLFARLDALWQYGTQQWLRHTVPQPTPRRTKWPTSPWWQVVQGVSFEVPDALPGQRKPVRDFHEGRCISALLGYAESYAAWASEEVEEVEAVSLRDILGVVLARAPDHYQQHETNWYDRVHEKRLRFGAPQQ